ncbi:MAG: hypothetical protein IJE69_07820 [Alistipes sp.]|nr:hypothetical protein [Alistipes sp.]
MEKEFNKVGRRMPYRVPEGFFEEQEKAILAQSVGSKTRFHRWWVGGVAAAVCLMVGLFGLHSADEPTFAPTALYGYTEQMNDEELTTWVEFYEADIFLSDAATNMDITFNNYNL